MGPTIVTHVSEWAGTMWPGTQGTVGLETIGGCGLIIFWPGVICSSGIVQLRDWVLGACIEWLIVLVGRPWDGRGKRGEVDDCLFWNGNGPRMLYWRTSTQLFLVAVLGALACC